MINVGNEIYTFVRSIVKQSYPSLKTSDEYQAEVSEFPIAIISQRDDYINTSRIDSGDLENAVNVMFEASVYSNKISGKKTEAYEIMDRVDYAFKLLGFVRTMCEPVDNLADATIYRLVARFEGTIDKKHLIYTLR